MPTTTAPYTFSEDDLPDPLTEQPEPTDQDENPHFQFTKAIDLPAWISKKQENPFVPLSVPLQVPTYEMTTANLAEPTVKYIEKVRDGDNEESGQS